MGECFVVVSMLIYGWMFCSCKYVDIWVNVL